MIAVLLSAYNGEKYIAEQIESLLAQTYEDFRVFIRDDNSTDKTRSIINNYKSKFPEKIELVDINGKNLGCGQSFMMLLKIVKADYYMYCDQDDVWLPTKIEETLSKIKEIDETGHGSTPCVAFTDAIVVDSNLNVLYDSLWNSNNRNPEDTKDVYRYEVYRQAALGCTMMFNNKAREICLQAIDYPDKSGHHDRLVIFICAHYGAITYLKKQLIKYRQHGTNVTSYTNRIYNRKKVLGSMKSPFYTQKRLYNRFKQLKKLPFHVSLIKLYITMLKKWI